MSVRRYNLVSKVLSALLMLKTLRQKETYCTMYSILLTNICSWGNNEPIQAYYPSSCRKRMK